MTIQILIKCRYLLLILVFGCGIAQGQALPVTAQGDLAQFEREGDFALVRHLVAETSTFYGLASYYNSVALYTLGEDSLVLLEPNQSISLGEGEKFVAVGRFNVLLLDAPGATIDIGEETFKVSGDAALQLDARILRKDTLADAGGGLDKLRYQHLWLPFALLSRAVEWSLVRIQAASGYSWGVALVLFTILLKILLLPLGIISARMQDEVSRHQSQLAPRLADIKARYDGEEAHKRIMAAHKEQGVSTFFALKPLLVTFIQVPVWVAVFNALGEMPQLVGQGFLWIESLAYPDSIASLPSALPLLGGSVSMLPVLMTVVTIVSALLFQDRHAPAEELKRQKRNLYLMALSFFVLFYPFPAAMVLYWTLSNALQIVQQRMIKVQDTS